MDDAEEGAIWELEHLVIDSTSRMAIAVTNDGVNTIILMWP